ncbi:MAG: hypothetical protein IJO28_01315 [Oscillospiraceae bacterium]|nr:hypothetical protein [Oscillospiraceae bacterium]
MEMKDLGYVIKRLFHMDYGAMIKKINSIHKKTGMSRLKIFRDMQNCAVNYGAGYMDYDLFEMYNLTPEQRDTYLTRGRNNALVKKYNDMSFGKCFIDKAEFNRRFGEYIKREWILMEQGNKEQVLEFLSRHQVLIAKPLDGCCGRGVEKLQVADFGGPEGCYEHLLNLGVQYELEELLIQHPQVSAVYPHAINTVRTVTVNHNGTPHLICTYFRIGNGGKHVDNFNNGGMVAPVDEHTGIVRDRAIDKNKNLYETHPMTGTPIKGFQFPYWQEAMELALKAATEVPQMGYIGWDVAFTPDGPCLVEGNDFPGHDIYQLPQHTPDKIGMMEKFSFMNEE